MSNLEIFVLFFLFRLSSKCLGVPVAPAVTEIIHCCALVEELGQPYLHRVYGLKIKFRETRLYVESRRKEVSSFATYNMTICN